MALFYQKEKTRYPDGQKRVGRTAGLIYGRPYVSRVHAASKYADLPEEEKEKRRAKAREYYYRKKYLVEPDPILPPNASVGNSTPSTIAGPATCNICCLVERCSFDKFSSFEF